MEPSYRAVSQFSGKSPYFRFCFTTGTLIIAATGREKIARQKQVIFPAVQNPRIFYTIREMLEKKFEKLTDKAEEEVQKVTANHLSVVRQAIKTLQDENVVDEATRDPEFRSMMAEKVEYVKRQQEEIDAVVRNIRQGANVA